jgi:hypothetical protein
VREVYLAQNPIEATLLVELLKAEGIEAVVQGEYLYAIRGLVPATYPTVWVVNDDEYDQARMMALEFDRQQQVDGDQEPLAPWVCPACGERIEGQFEQCWHCGADRPAGDQGS